MDAVARASGHNDEVAGRTGRLVAFFARAEPRGAPPSGWALALDAAVAVGAAAGAVSRWPARTFLTSVRAGLGWCAPGRRLLPACRSALLTPLACAPSFDVLAAAALTALPLAVRRFYPISAWLVDRRRDRVRPSPPTYRRSRSAPPSTPPTARSCTAGTGTSRSPWWPWSPSWPPGRSANQLPRFPGRLTAVVAVAAAAAAGLGIRVLRRRLADSAARLRRAADEAQAATERALAAERSRIAAELHDVVTHNVSVMIVQAGAARKIMASSPADAEDALLAVEASGREAMTELRNLLGLLSPAGDGSDGGAGVPAAASRRRRAPATAGTAAGPGAAALRPQPGLDELDALIGRVSAAGLPVELRVSGAPRPLPPGADLAAYRVVQEGLTNVLRHAGAASATVAVDWGEHLEITVSDDGHGEPGAGAGRRAAACSGCGSGSRSTAGSWRRGRGRTAAGRSGRRCH